MCARLREPPDPQPAAQRPSAEFWCDGAQTQSMHCVRGSVRVNENRCSNAGRLEVIKAAAEMGVLVFRTGTQKLHARPIVPRVHVWGENNLKSDLNLEQS